MGSSSSVLTKDILNEYMELTYLSKPEILQLYKKFSTLAGENEEFDIQCRYHVQSIKELFPQLKYNPFRDRIYEVFSSRKDLCFSFEDMLDLCSVMSENCPTNVKAVWAFRIFDFDEDGQLSERDIMTIIDRLTQGLDRNRVIPSTGQKTIVQILLKDMAMEASGSINQLEFKHAVTKMSDFHNTFSFKI